MKHTNKYILFLLINLVVVFLPIIMYGASLNGALTSNGLWIMPLLGVLVGVLLGFLFSLPFSKDWEDKAYLWGQILSCLLLLLLSARLGQDWESRNNNKNMEHNRDIMLYQVDDHEHYIRTAFQKLEKSFPHPNDFSLESFHINKKDTMVENTRDTVYTIYFTYFVNKSNERERLSKFTVFQNKTQVQFLHYLAQSNVEYQQLKRAFREENKESIKEAERLMDQMERLGSQAVIDSLEKVYK